MRWREYNDEHQVLCRRMRQLCGSQRFSDGRRQQPLQSLGFRDVCALKAKTGRSEAGIL